ncbi:MAG TPA: motility protein A [Egibacteraceae bacterium]|nr:motility protein A [Egibacteraceae bacterium]
MDPLLIGGFLLALLSIVVATLIDGNAFGPLVGPSSFVLVFFGTIGAALMAYRKADLSRFPKAALQAFRGSPPDVDATVTTLAGLADTARKDGMLALEARLVDVSDEGVRRGLQLVVDGLDADEVREVVEIDIAAVDERHRVCIGFFTALGGYSPTFGMLGTVVGLVNMLQNLTDPAQLGVGMALALLTTFYGVLFANLVWLPLASRLTRLNDQELAARDIALDGILSIQAGASPRLLVERLETYLPPAQRVGYAARAAVTPLAAVPPRAA